MRSPPTEPLFELADTWRQLTRTPRLRAVLAIGILGSACAFLGARFGTSGARAGAACALAAAVVAAFAWRTALRRRLLGPHQILRNLVSPVDPARAERAVRALSFLDSAGKFRDDGTSMDLARLHVERTLAAIPVDAVAQRASRTATRWGIVAAIVGLSAAALLVVSGWSVVEGADVLLSRHGAAPFSMAWLGGVELTIRPPDYLHENTIHELGRSPLRLPYGSVITLRGVPVRAGRELRLSDGVAELPFVEDGEGGVVARYTLAESRVLRVAARFGDVVIGDGEDLPIQSIADEAPKVTLEDAPREVHLLDATDGIPIRYEATDDHGLREVHLVLRSGTREERRLLARLDGDTLTDRGGEVLKLRDPFLAKSHTPVEVTVEAKDNDPLTGPKWGASAAITVIPPDVGDPEAQELLALRSVRDALVDALAFRIPREMPSDPSARKAFVAEDAALETASERALDQALSLTIAGVRVPSHVRALLSAQKERMHAAVEGEIRGAPALAEAAAVKSTERFLLVLDAVIRGLGERDARASAKQLADVADDLVLGLGQMKNDTANTRSRGTSRALAATGVLRGGGRVMTELGELGRDLGEIVDAYLLRVARARDADDLLHGEFAARDLAARLRQPDPSFGSRGGARRAASESGGSPGSLSEGGDESSAEDDVEQAFDQAAQDLERLAQDHAGEVAKTEQAMADATSDDERKSARDEAKQHADAIREAARKLPAVGSGSNSWTSKGAAARDLAQQMAQSLEEGRPDSAMQSGRSALGSLDEAKKMLQRGGWLDDPNGEEQRGVDEARKTLEAESRWAEQAMSESRKRASMRARGELEQGGDEEGKLADRAQELGEKGHGAGALPEQVSDSIERAARAARQAAEALARGDADNGLERQREAQQDLEVARSALRGDEDESSRSEDNGDGRDGSHAPVAIPKANEHKGPEGFRRRVLRGLAGPAGGGLRDAVQRYAEGLLR